MNSEQWKPVIGFEGLYEVSNAGQVRRNGKLLRPQRKSRTGHVGFMLWKGGAPHGRLLHRLVLEAFVGPCPNGMQARHFPDRDPRNNALENLQWGTPSENAVDKLTHGTQNTARLTPVDVERIRDLMAAGERNKDIAAWVGVSKHVLTDIRTGRSWRHA